MPRWAHFPLILKPDGGGKLSKRDGERLGFPVYAMNWTDPVTHETTPGFREKGFLPEAFVNILALLGWNDGTEQEVFSLPELVEKFSIDRVHKGGAKFNYEKAKWFNHEYLKRLPDGELLPYFAAQLSRHGIRETEARMGEIVALIKDRCTLLPDLWENSFFLFERPASWDVDSVAKKWDADKRAFFEALPDALAGLEPFAAESLETAFKTLAESRGLKAGGLMLPLRVMLVGGKFGPPVFSIAGLLGKGETLIRIRQALPAFG